MKTTGKGSEPVRVDLKDGNEETWFEYVYTESLTFIHRQYVTRNQNHRSTIFVHVTNATDANNIQKVFWDVQNPVFLFFFFPSPLLYQWATILNFSRFFFFGFLFFFFARFVCLTVFLLWVMFFGEILNLSNNFNLSVTSEILPINPHKQIHQTPKTKSCENFPFTEPFVKKNQTIIKMDYDISLLENNSSSLTTTSSSSQHAEEAVRYCHLSKNDASQVLWENKHTKKKKIDAIKDVTKKVEKNFLDKISLYNIISTGLFASFPSLTNSYFLFRLNNLRIVTHIYYTTLCLVITICSCGYVIQDFVRFEVSKKRRRRRGGERRIIIKQTITITIIFKKKKKKCKEKRKVPARLVLSRTVVDLLFGLLCFIMIEVVSSDSPAAVWCHWLAALFTFFFLLSEAYFVGICWDIWLTLSNPFRKPASDSYQIHVISILVVLALAIFSELINAFQFREDVEVNFYFYFFVLFYFMSSLSPFFFFLRGNYI
ncbi:hypothetical protein RFI_20190 [Reticulomyxa filosa]|uniref:Transmembrane protein n=1 Tax=Reticulomyxa filosa TaxID=46433 RepID=X6MT29_RETFI|nr:hypothetical protein RFI_20190 [Reticulomyxa filosa]|eukprot:ETO17143.1 hypothetical protein RFI_20190 [Reticulomyxa filosa]